MPHNPTPAVKATSSLPMFKKGQHFQTSSALTRLKAQQHLGVALEQGSYIVFDLETTGGNPERNGITEIFALRWCEGKIIDTFYSMVNPQVPIPPIVRRMTGISNQMVKDAPKIDDVMPRFIEFIGDDVLVSHNTIGDMKFLVYFADRVCHHALENFYLCTHLLSEKLISSAPDKSLGGLARYLEVPNGTLHRAEADTYLTLELFKVLLQRALHAGVVSIADGIRLQGDLNSRLRLGWSLPDDAEQRIPAEPGVLQFFDRQRKLLFLTSASDMKRQFKELSQVESLPKTLQKTILLSAELEIHASPDLFGAMLVEARLGCKLKQGFLPIHWHLRFLWAICAVAVDKGGEVFELKVAPLGERTVAAWGPIYDRKTAQAALESLAERFAVPCSNKHGLRLKAHQLPLVTAWLSRSREARGYFYMGKVLSVKTLVSQEFRLELLDSWRLTKILRETRCALKVQPLLHTYGLLVKQTLGARNLVIVPVQGSQPGAELIVEGDLHSWLAGNAGKAVVAALHAAQQRAQVAAWHELSAKEANAANAVQWMIHGIKAQKQDAYRFYQLATL